MQLAVIGTHSSPTISDCLMPTINKHAYVYSEQTWCPRLRPKICNVWHPKVQPTTTFEDGNVIKLCNVLLATLELITSLVHRGRHRVHLAKLAEQHASSKLLTTRETPVMHSIRSAGFGAAGFFLCWVSFGSVLTSQISLQVLSYPNSTARS